MAVKTFSWRKQYTTEFVVTSADATATFIEIQMKKGVSVDFPSDELIYSYFIKTVAGVDKSGFSSSYDKDTGILRIDNATGTFVADDTVMVGGSFYKV